MRRHFGDARKPGHFHSDLLNPLDMLRGNTNDHVDRARYGMDGLHGGDRPHFRCDLGTANATLKPNHQISTLACAATTFEDREAGDRAGGLEFGKAILCRGAREAKIPRKRNNWAARVAS